MRCDAAMSFVLWLIAGLWLPMMGRSIPAASGFKAIENKGQWPQAVYFRSDLKAGGVFFQNREIIFQLSHPDDLQHENRDLDYPVRCHGLSLEYIGSNPNCIPKGRVNQGTIYNYFIGDNSKHWASSANAYSNVEYKDLYPGIQLNWEGNSGHLTYSLDLAPQADWRNFQFCYKGADSVRLKESGELIIYTSVRTITETKPKAWVLDKVDTWIAIDIKFQLRGDTIGFYIPQNVTGKAIRIDPTLIFSSYTGSVADNFGFTATYDLSGNLYAGGRVYSAGYPVFGPYQSSFQGMYDVGISKFNASGTQMIYSTYLGGTDVEQPHSLAVNSQDELFVLGTTKSTNFPVVQAIQGSLGGEYDIFISRFSASGNQLLASTYLGGSQEDGYNNFGLNFNYGDEYRGEIFIDSSDLVYIASNSASGNFPVTPGCFQGSFAGIQDGIVGSFSSDLLNARWISFIGGSNIDAVYGVKVNASGNVLVTGGTQSADFPIRSGAYQSNRGGGIDGFAGIISSDGSSLTQSSFIGTAGIDQSYFIQVDGDEQIHLYGQSTGNMPIQSSPFGTVYSNTNGKQFIICLDSLLSVRIFSTVFGAGRQGPDISPTAFLVDRCGSIYCSGWASTFQGVGNGSNVYLNASGLAVTSNALKATTDGTDFYLMVLKKLGTGLLYGTFLGGNQSREHVDGGTSRFSPQGIVYHAVCAGCGGNSDFPTTSGVVATQNNSTNCNLAAFKLDFEPQAKADFIWSTQSLCPPYQVQFTYQGLGADQYHWDFGMSPADTANGAGPSYGFPASGSYEVTLIAQEFTCMGTDTAVKTISLSPQKFANWNQEYNPCSPVLSATYSGQAADSLIWIPDSLPISRSNPIAEFTFPSPGQYTLQLIAWKSGCADTLLDTFSFASAPPADFSFKIDTCSRYAEFTSGVSDSFRLGWDFGDGTISNEKNPRHQFPTIEKFPVRMLVSTDSCSTTLEKWVDLAIPTEQFLFLPNIFTPNGDGIHDQFKIELKNSEIFELSIWDRWGNLLFETKNPEMLWTGEVKGKPVEEGVYFYVLKTRNCIGDLENRQGSVTVLR